VSLVSPVMSRFSLPVNQVKPLMIDLDLSWGGSAFFEGVTPRATGEPDVMEQQDVMEKLDFAIGAF
jgi:hypothetical protein